MAAGTVTVVGLGPSGMAQMTVAATAAVEAAAHLVVRTSQHPAVAELAAAGVELESCDDLYDAAPTLPDAYEAIVARVLGPAAEGRDVTYAVPGSPHVAEASVRLLRDRAPAAGVGLGFVDGMSFLEPVLAAVGADPAVDGVFVCDGRRLPDHLGSWFSDAKVGVLSNLLVCQVDRADVLGDAKLALLEAVAAEHEVALVVGAGTPDVEVRRAPLAELDWGQIDPGPLASLWVPSTAAVTQGGPSVPFEVRPSHREAGQSFAALVALVDRLRSPGGCPWDGEQTHASLAAHLLEEAYEVLDVLDRFPAGAPPAPVDAALYAHLEEELGDFLMQAVFHARLAQESGAFDIAAVADGIVDKLVARHPHVFGDVEAATGIEVVANWERIKATEKGRLSAVDDIPSALPALTRAAKLIRRTSVAGLDWGDASAALDHIDPVTGDVGAVLLAVCAWARALGVDGEESLRAELAHLESVFRAVEGTALLEATDAWAILEQASPDGGFPS